MKKQNSFQGITTVLCLVIFLYVYSSISNVTAGDGTLTYFPLVGKASPPKWIGPYGGSVVSIAVDPNQPNIVYAGSWGGGVFKSVNGGKTWSFAGEGLGVLYIDSLAVDPEISTTIYAGTHGGGVYKSTNGGISWYSVNNGIQNRAVVYTITVNPGNHSLVYAGTRGAPETPGPPWSGILYKSSNAGASWYPVLSNVGGTDQQDWVYSVRVNPSSPETILAATHEHGPYIANDYGGQDDWGISETVSDWSGRAVDFDPRSWMQTAYYATWHGDGIYKSTNGGYHWELSNSGMGFAKIYPNGIAYEPGNPSSVYLASFGNDVHGVLKSTDAGDSWSLAGLSQRYIYSVGAPANSTDIVYAGTLSDGFYKSSNGGSSWNHYITGFMNANVTGLVFRDEVTVYASTKGGGVFRSLDGGLTWSDFNANLSDRTINGLIQDPANPDILYALTKASGLQKYNLSTGSGWGLAEIPFSEPLKREAPIADPLSRHEPIEELLGYLPEINDLSLVAGITAPVLSMAFAPSNTKIAYVGSDGSGIYKTTNGGVSWVPVGLTGTSILGITIHPTNPQMVYVATSQVGIIKVSVNGGTSWADMVTIPGNESVSCILTVSTEPDTLYAGTSNGIWKYAGAAWTFVGLKSSTVTVLKNSPKSPSILYAGTTSGAYLSLNRLDWANVDPGNNSYAISTIQFYQQNGENFLYLGTTTRGTRQIPVP